ncbi:HIT-like domain containing protein [Trema orientale]|uniref:HIT-like domain containing protein n=1 Tax=Trema orientale TaxID=63057 RepID=A0A2P5F5G1_TREOI|nr:HIT-like domain containing protein [Trema orientale]
MAEATAAQPNCIFCQIATKSTNNTTILHSDDKVVAFPDISPAAIWLSSASMEQCQPFTPPLSGTTLHTQDDKVVAFPDISPAAVRHYLVIPAAHIPSVNDLQKGAEDYSLVNHMLEVGQTLLRRDAPECQFRFGFHRPPLNTVKHLHLHCLALPYTPRWKCVKFLSLGPVGFLEADKLLEKIKPSN